MSEDDPMKFLYVTFSLLLAAGILLFSLSAHGDKKVTLRGWVSDEACGALHTKPGGEGCIRKCLRGGVAIGHPEWLPQRLVLVSDSDQKSWIVENPESLSGREGKHVEVRATLDSAEGSLRIGRVLEVQPSANP